MNREQADKIIDIIKTGADIRGDFFSDSGACVLGSLYNAIDKGEDEDGKVAYVGIFCRIRTHYDMTTRQSWKLSSVNDAHAEVGPRREALISLVEAWMIEEWMA